MSEEEKNKKDKKAKEKDVTAYFDGDCPMCKTFVPWLQNTELDGTKDKNSVKFENLRTKELPDSINKDKAIEKIHLVDKNGDILTGAKAVFAAKVSAAQPIFATRLFTESLASIVCIRAKGSGVLPFQ